MILANTVVSWPASSPARIRLTKTGENTAGNSAIAPDRFLPPSMPSIMAAVTSRSRTPARTSCSR